MNSFSYTFEVFSRDRTHRKEVVGGRSLEGRKIAAWDFARRETRGLDVKIGRLIATDDPNAQPDRGEAR